MEPEKHSFSDMLTGNLRVIRNNLVLYVIPIPYLFVGGIIVSVMMYISLVFVLGVTFFNLTFTEKLSEVISVSITGLFWFFFLYFLIIISFVSGYLGGLGQMLKMVSATGKARFADFVSGVFTYGPRLFFGLIAFTIIMLIPIYWAFQSVLQNYLIYDFATMDSGWNSQLRSSITDAQSGINFQMQLMQILIFLLLGFWWIVSIIETRHFITSFIKSIQFALTNPVKTSVALIGGLISLGLATLLFSFVFQTINFLPDYGGLIGFYLFLPLLTLFLIQTYKPQYFNRIANNLSQSDIPSGTSTRVITHDDDDILIELNPTDRHDNLT